MVHEKIDEVLFLIWNISKTIRNSQSQIASFDLLATGDLMGSKIAGKIMKVSRTSLHFSSEKVEYEAEIIYFEKEIPEERHTSRKESKLLMI